MAHGCGSCAAPCRFGRRSESNRHGVAPGDLESYPRRFGKQLTGNGLRRIPLAASGFRRQIQFILFPSTSVFLACFDLFVSPDCHRKHSLSGG